jgi:hypothetical protein
MKSWIGIVIGMVMLAACGGPAQEQAQNENDKFKDLKEQIMASHDIAMAEMTTLSKLKKELKANWDTQEDTTTYHTMYIELQKPHDGMMTWMREFENVDEKDWTDAEKKAYLEEELVKVKRLEDQTLAVIQRTRTVLGK